MKPLSDYIGIPYRDVGRDRSGLDCWGLVRLYLAEQLGVHLPSYDGEYTSAEDAMDVGRIITVEKGILWHRVSKPKTYDVVLLNIKKVPCHCGVVVGKNVMLHILKGCNSVIERYAGVIWRNRIEGFYRWT